MRKREAYGRPELWTALRASRRLFIAVALFSVLVNLLMLTGPLYMLQVYDRVLASGSQETLVALSVLVAALFIGMGLLDFARTRVLARAGARFQALLDRRVFDSVLRRAVVPQERGKPSTGLRDLEAIQRALSGPAPFAFFDAPWAPFFLAVIFMFHWSLGALAFAGGLLLFAVALLNERQARAPLAEAAAATGRSEAVAEMLRREGEVIEGLGMRDAAIARWGALRDNALAAQIAGSDATSGYAVTSKTLRFALQSAMLGLGAWLAIQGLVTPGVMIAASILMGRALAPVEQAIAQWAMVQRAFRGWRSLAELLERMPPPPRRTALPPAVGVLHVEGLGVAPPGTQVPTLHGVTFRVEPGQALGVIGASGAGKSTLARVLSGVWRPQMGSVRLDGATLDQYSAEERGRRIGYLPQDLALFDGTVAENIARFREPRDDAAVVAAAQRAGAHEMILSLPGGYDTPIGVGGGALSGGQRQRIALARALYGDPAVLVLDEPNSNLDAEGELALISAIKTLKATGRTVIVMAHRPSAIGACDLLLMLKDGAMRAFGPRDAVLRETTANYEQLLRAGPVGASVGVEESRP